MTIEEARKRLVEINQDLLLMATNWARSLGADPDFVAVDAFITSIELRVQEAMVKQ